MPYYNKKDIAKFQKLYQDFYNEIISIEEAIVKTDALVDLIRLSIECESKLMNKKSK